MRERADRAGIALDIRSAPGAGVTVEDPRVALCVSRTCQMMPPSCQVSESRSYASRDHQKCIATLIDCKSGFAPFFDQCGCHRHHRRA